MLLKPAPGFDAAMEGEPDPSTLLLSGAITHGNQVVGHFEVMGDDSVVIRDADGKIVSAH